jgi:nitric oxide reductase large subunit
VRIFAAVISGLALLWLLFLALYTYLHWRDTKSLRFLREKGWVWISLLASIAMWVFLAAGVYEPAHTHHRGPRRSTRETELSQGNTWRFGE